MTERGEPQEIAMSEHGARVLLGASREARGRAFTNDERRTAPALKVQSLDASAPEAGRLLQSDSTQTRSLEGRPLTMHSALRLPDRSGLRLLSA